MYQRLKDAFFAMPKIQNEKFVSSLDEWRADLLNLILGGIFVFWVLAFIGSIRNVIDLYNKSQSLLNNPKLVAISVIVFYGIVTTLVGYVTFNRRLNVNLRAGILLFSLYALGTSGMLLTSFSGDGRVLLFAFVIFSGIFFNLRYSLAAFFVTLLTLVSIGYLQISGLMVVPPEWQVNAANPGAWFSGGLVLIVLSVAGIYSIAYLLQSFEASLKETQEALQREQRLGGVLRTVSEINQIIVRAQDPEKMLHDACELLVAGQGYSFAWVGLLDEDMVTLRHVAHAGDVVDESEFNTRLDLESGLTCAIQAIRTRSFFIVNPSDRNGDPCEKCPRIGKFPNRSAISLPLQRDAKIFGVLVVDHTELAAAFDEQEISLLVELAGDLSYALENLEASKRLDTIARYQTLLNEVTQTALSAFDLDTLLKDFIEKLEKALDADGYYFAMWDEARGVPSKFIFSQKFHDIFVTPPLLEPDDKFFTRAILEEKRILIIQNVMDTPYINPAFAEQFNVQSAMGIPLIADQMRIGALVLGYSDQHVLTSEEVKLADQSMNQFALAILKVKLNDEMRAKAKELEQLYTAAQDMTASLMDPPALLKEMARHMAEALDVTSTYITSFDLQVMSMKVVAEYWGKESAPAELKSDLGRDYPSADYATVLKAMMEGRSLVLHAGQPNLTSEEYQQFVDYHIETMMFVPIYSRGRLLGTVELWESRKRREFSQAEIRLANAMTSHAANIIENSTLFALTRKRESELSALLSVTRAISSSLQLPDVLREATTTLARMMRVDFCSISDYLPESNLLITRAIYSAEDDVSEQGDIGKEFSLEHYPATLYVLQTGKPLVTRMDDAGADPAEVQQLKNDGMFSSLLIPLRVRGYSLGLAELFSSDESRHFQQEEIQFASTLADQVAVAIENAYLYERLEQREAYFRALVENSTEGVAILDQQGIVRYLAPAEERLTGYSVDEIVGGSAFKYIHPDDLSKVLDMFQQGIENPGVVLSVQYRLKMKNGEWGHFEVSGSNMLGIPDIAGIVVNYRNITERVRTEKAIEESEERYRTIFESAGIPIWEDDYSEFMASIEELKRKGITDFRKYFTEHPEFVERAASMIRITGVNAAAMSLMGATTKSQLIGALDSVLFSQPSNRFIDDVVALTDGRRHIEQESELFTLSGERRDVWVTINLPERAKGYERVLVSTLDITERKQIENALIESQGRLLGIVTTAPNGIITVDANIRIILMNPAAEKIFGYLAEEVLGQSLNMLLPERFREHHAKYIQSYSASGVSHRKLGRYDSLYGIRKNGEEFPMEAFISRYEMEGEKFFTVILQDITVRKQDEDNLRRRAEELQTLVIVSSALRSAVKVDEIIPLVARYSAEIVGGTYSTVYLLDQSSDALVSPGWYSVRNGEDIKTTTAPLLRNASGNGITGYVASTGNIYITEDLRNDPKASILPDEIETLRDAHSGISLPLLSQEMVIGVLHVRLTEKHVFNETEIRLLTAIAEMAGNALHRTKLYEQTVQQSEELAQAYDNTLSGWARALELRDELTEGHTRRVTELTLELARAMNISESELVQIRRGAILHDIGKMGIPDAILNKPGPLTAHEIRIMQMHTQYAYEMISFIPFLKPAIDIPYCHHEWWNGNGYPRGLKGEEIPLSARIFAVIDVWDALTSDRPYRAAWSTENALKYIQDGSEKQFDPKVVDAFLKLIENRKL